MTENKAPRERGILYGAPMVRAYLEDLKTQTRRTVKLPPWVTDAESAVFRLNEMAKRGEVPGLALMIDGRPAKRFICPYGGMGDLLRGKEAAWVWCRKERDGETKTGRPKFNYLPIGRHVIYQVDELSNPDHRIDSDPDHGWRLKIGRYLPRWASRLLAEIVSVRIERLQGITDQDAEQEGVMHWAAVHVGLLRAARIAVPDRPRFFYQMLWIQINGQESWDSNPWVWVVTFKRCERTDLSVVR